MLQARPLSRHIASCLSNPAYRLLWRRSMQNLAKASTADESQINRAERTLNKFWQAASVQKQGNAFEVYLDKRRLKTQETKEQLLIPTEALAVLVAGEWEAQKKTLKPHALPITAIVSRARTFLADAEHRRQVVRDLTPYLDTDATCYYHHHPPRLVELQKAHWDPLHAILAKEYGVTIKTTNGIIPIKQDASVKQQLVDIVLRWDPIQLAAFERGVRFSKSFIIPFLMIEKKISLTKAIAAHSVEADSQVEQWGMVEDAHDVEEKNMKKWFAAIAAVNSALSIH